MSVRNVLSIAAALVLLFFSLPQESSAPVSASIGGSVSDPTGALIPGVEVTATIVNTGISTTQLTNGAKDRGACPEPMMMASNSCVEVITSSRIRIDLVSN